MVQLDSTTHWLRASLLCLSLTQTGCSSTDRSSGAHTADPGDDSRPDGGSRRDAGGKESGSNNSTSKPAPGGTSPTTNAGNDGANAPKKFERIDACGDDNSARLTAAQIDELKTGGDSDALTVLYPYDGTVFPRGLAAPKFMWQGAAGTAVFLRIRSTYFEYDGCLLPTAAGQLDLAQDIWDKAGDQTLGPSTPFEVSLTVLDGTSVIGPIKQSLVIAQATLKGSIYYGSYNSSAGSAGAIGLPTGGLSLPGGLGSILRIRPGKPAEFFARNGSCTGCHAVSANGERMIAKDLGSPSGGSVYKLTPDTPPNSQPAGGAVSPAFTGLSPDGSVYINNAVLNGVGPNIVGAGNGLIVMQASATLRETDTGTEITDSGIPSTAAMTTFSADGKLLTFNDLSMARGSGISLMDYDSKTRRASHARVLLSGVNGYAGWPFLLPDNGAVVFTSTDASDFTGRGVGITLPFGGPRSDLMIVDATSGKANMLARAMGFATAADAEANLTYLPFGTADLHQNYYPTVSPVAAGGYFWVFFDSVRNYGNLGLRRQLWGTAIAIQHGAEEFSTEDGLYGTDPSAPAFYVPGQELDSANHRAFTALDPCREDGSSCQSGVDCCSGFCTEGVCGPANGCSETSDACEGDTDCCHSEDRCIAGFCGQIIL